MANPAVIAHRGACGYLPEHTLQAVELAHQQGADYLEQDVVLTADGIPIVLHDVTLELTTNVASIFEGRQRDDGLFYAIDFTLAEIKQLTAHERTDLSGNAVFPDGRNADAAARLGAARTGGTAGIPGSGVPGVQLPAWLRQAPPRVRRRSGRPDCAGLSLSVVGSASRLRDQLSIPHRGATPEEVLLNLRRLRSGYEYRLNVGLTYRFGSIFSSIVNPRFGQ